MTVTPSPQTVLEGNQYTFNSNVNATWAVSGDGTIPSCTSAATSCIFVAGATTGTATLTATATDGSGATGQANITISSLVLSPTSITVVAGETQTYSSTPSSVPVTYSANPTTLGSFSGNTFTAANTTGSGTVTATATDGSGATGTAKISVTPLAITPTTPNVAEGQTLTLNTNAPVSWSVSGDGTLVTPCATTSCVFTANSTGTQAVVTATETSTAALQTQATVTLGPLTLTPGEPPASPATTVENQTQVFTANAPIPSGNWAAKLRTN